MGYDHAEQREIPPQYSSGGSSGSDQDEITIEKLPALHPQRTEDTTKDDEAEGTTALHHTHTHTLGKLQLRAVDDDDPS